MNEPLNPYAAPATSSEYIAEHQSIDPRLTTTGKGLRLIYGSVVALLLIWIGSIPLMMLSMGVPTFAPLILFAIALFGVFIAFVAGTLMCLTVPAGLALRPWIIATVICESTVLTTSFADMAGLFFRYMPLVTIAGYVLGLSFFLMFSYRLAEYIRRADLVRSARRVGILGAVLVVTGLFFALQIFAEEPMGLAWFVLVYFGFFLIFFVSYANLIGKLSKGILRGGRPREISPSTAMPIDPIVSQQVNSERANSEQKIGEQAISDSEPTTPAKSSPAEESE